MEKNADRSVDVHEQGFPEGNLTLIQKRRINMATDKVALTASMRSNLLSLKNTQKMFDKTPIFIYNTVVFMSSVI